MKKNQLKQPTLKDLAAATGVSINTVSRALRGKDDIAEKTREKIKKAAAQMGYVNNMIASSLRLGYTNTIAVLLSDISNPYFAIMMKDIEGRARELGYTSFLINTNEDDDLERQAIRGALNKNVDGLLICPSQRSEDNVRYLMKCGLPFVLIGRRFKNVVTDYASSDDESGGRLATQALIDRGHRRILMLGGPSYISSASERLAGYRRALAENGLPFDERLARQVDVAAKDFDDLAGELADGSLDCTAIFAFSDLLAWNLWAALGRRGLRVPEDFSLIGYDNIRSRLAVPGGLCSIDAAKGRMAAAAVDILAAKMRGQSSEPVQVLTIPTFRDGLTVAAPRRA